MDNLVRNPKCGTCKSYWKPDETDILTSGLLAKCCKKCRNRQKELRENRDYSKGKIYVVKSLTSPEIYVGSTIQTLADRMYCHRNDWKKNEVLGRNKEIVKDINVWYIELYEEYPCKNITELNKREGDIIKEIGTLNNRIEGRTRQEYNADHKEERKQYNLKNKDKIKEQRKQYYTDHKEERKQYQKQYNTYHDDEIKEYKKQLFKKKKLEKQALVAIQV